MVVGWAWKDGDFWDELLRYHRDTGKKSLFLVALMAKRAWLGQLSWGY